MRLAKERMKNKPEQKRSIERGGKKLPIGMFSPKTTRTKKPPNFAYVRKSKWNLTSFGFNLTKEEIEARAKLRFKDFTIVDLKQDLDQLDEHYENSKENQG